MPESDNSLWCLTEQELYLIFREMQPRSAALCAMLLACSGISLEEAMALRVRDLNLDFCLVRASAGKPQERKLVFAHSLAEALGSMSAGKEPGEFLFSSIPTLDAGMVEDVILQSGRANLMKDVTVQDLRFTFARSLISRKVEPRIIASIMGLDNPGSLQQYLDYSGPPGL